MLEDVSFWAALDADAQQRIRRSMTTRRVRRGEMLLRQDDPADHLYIVNSGLFEVKNASGAAVVEIGPGQLIGEIGFFSDSPRTASVFAARDSEVLEIHRDTFEALTTKVPEIQRAITKALARRLARIAPLVRDHEAAGPLSPRRMIAVAGAGRGELAADFVARFRASVPGRFRVRFLTPDDAASLLAGSAADALPYARALSAIERENDLVVCVVSPEIDDWTTAALRSCDQVLLIAGGEALPSGPVESLALQLFPQARRRLVLLEPRRVGFAPSRADWRQGRETFMIHHVSLEDDADLESLWRFLSGEAIGLVASGGGAFGPAHIGIQRAFAERGVAFDIYGGASVGSAMAASFAALQDPDQTEIGMREMFVRRGALKRLAFPRYGLLDHRVFDAELRARYIGDIEDLWKPYFAVATDLSTYSLRVIRTGPVWQSIRASAAIPGVLPPWFGADGHMLVDGGVSDNVPVRAMRSLKSGPNLVIDLRPQVYRRFKVDYDAIPGRWSVLARSLAPWPGPRGLPRVPGPVAVIQRSLFSNSPDKAEFADSPRLTLRPPAFPGSSFMNWDRHAEVLDASYKWASKTIDKLVETQEPVFARMLALSNTRA